MGVRITAFLAVAAVICGVGIWGWSNHCEDYDLCYPACRAPSNGVEYWKTLPAAHGKSEWIAAGASPGSECLSLLSIMQAKHPGKQVAIDYVNLANDRKPAPFYQYDCAFDIKEPVFNRARHETCQRAPKRP